MTTVQVGPGLDYTTIGAAAAAADLTGGTGWHIEVHDKGSAYDESVTVTSVTGTPSASNYLWFYSALADRHTGTRGSGLQWVTSTPGSPILDLRVHHGRVTGFDMRLQHTSPTTVGLDLAGTGLLIEDCLISGERQTASVRDGIRPGGYQNYGSTVSLSDCAIYGWSRVGVVMSVQPGFHTSVLNMDHCTVYDCNLTDDNIYGAAVFAYTASSAVTHTLNLHNSVFCGTRNGNTDLADGGNDRGSPPGTVTWNGSNNLHTSNLADIDGTNNTTAWQDASAGGATDVPTTPNAVIFNDLTATAEDLRLLAATGAGSNLAVDTGVNRQGSEPDARQDFSTDGTGNPRPTVDVDLGFAELAAVGPPTKTGALSLSGVGTLGLAGRSTKNLTGALSLSAVGTLGLAGQVQLPGVGALSLQGVGTLGLAGRTFATRTGALPLSAVGTLGLRGRVPSPALEILADFGRLRQTVSLTEAQRV